MITGIDHLVLRVADIERSVAWYAEHLGLVAERLDEWRAGTALFVSLRVDDSTLVDLLQVPPEGVNVDHVAYVADAATYDRFVDERGPMIEVGPAQLFGARGNGEGVYVRDPDGHLVELRTYR